MPTISLPQQLKQLIGSSNDITAPIGSLSEILTTVTLNYPLLKPYLLTPEQELCDFVNIYVNGKNVRQLEGLETQIHQDDVLNVVLAVVGG